MFVIWARREDINCISIGQINELRFSAAVLLI